MDYFIDHFRLCSDEDSSPPSSFDDFPVGGKLTTTLLMISHEQFVHQVASTEVNCGGKDCVHCANGNEPMGRIVFPLWTFENDCQDVLVLPFRGHHLKKLVLGLRNDLQGWKFEVNRTTMGVKISTLGPLSDDERRRISREWSMSEIPKHCDETPFPFDEIWCTESDDHFVNVSHTPPTPRLGYFAVQHQLSGKEIQK